jgi:site-specific recombinase XerD
MRTERDLKPQKETSMGLLRDRMREDLKLSGYSPSTCKIYLIYARLFAKFHMRSPEEMSEPEIRQFLLHLVEERKVSHQTYRQVRAGLMFLYGVTLRRPAEIEHIAIPRRHTRLPEVLSGTEVASLVAAIRNPKYRGIVMTMYSGGLRVAEACRLRPEDIDSKRMVILVRGGKGGRDRYTLLSERLLEFLRDYWRKTRPQGWLFPSRTGDQPLSPDAVRLMFRSALKTAGISKKVTPHALRHSFATHLLESGVDITVVQTLLGHASLRVTEVYAHISVEHIGRTRSPLDLLGTSESKILG